MIYDSYFLFFFLSDLSFQVIIEFYVESLRKVSNRLWTALGQSIRKLYCPEP